MDISKLKIGLVSASLSHMEARERTHTTLVRSSVDGAVAELKKLGLDIEKQIILKEVPGVLEVPIMCKRLIKNQQVDGIIAFGLIIDGGIYRHEFVAQSSLDLIMHLSLSTSTPVASCLLAPQAKNAVETEFDMLFENLSDKGAESARALLEQIELLNAV
ncbi:6,7-dimethyl-8-ribityllumazine synthase [Candidatus Saccharibacteria bacterium]|nr:6,7-dimethyl-8-ribityllumazine synthase [Candidatus Saccharibacteria bacterium]